MLRRWNSVVHATLGPGAISVEVLGRGGKRRYHSEAPTGATLEKALDALDAALTRARAAGQKLSGLRCDVVIQDAWVLYDVIEGDWASLPPDAAGEMIAAALADVGGAAPGELKTAWQRQSSSTRALACALPATAVTRIEQIWQVHGLRAGRVVGEFVHEFNAARDRLVADCAVIALSRNAGAQVAIALDGALAGFSFEIGRQTPVELEARGRGLLRAAGVEPGPLTRYYVLRSLEAETVAPWIAIPPAARSARAATPPPATTVIAPATVTAAPASVPALVPVPADTTASA